MGFYNTGIYILNLYDVTFSFETFDEIQFEFHAQIRCILCGSCVSHGFEYEEYCFLGCETS
jgi:hypothetical protein